jgi:hypothetical protein
MGKRLFDQAFEGGEVDKVSDAIRRRLQAAPGQDEDPKAAAGSAKVSMMHFPPSVLAEVSEVFRLGSKKYGAFNWTESPKKASVYYEAFWRHMGAYWQGETYDPETGLRHSAHAIASLVILMVQEDLGLLIDDRPKGLPDFAEKAAELLSKRKEE